MNRQALGRIGETAAVRLLTERGYRICDQNFRCPLGELDLVAEDRGQVIFVEVKTRTTDEYGDPFEAVAPLKRRRLVRLAAYYLAVRHLSGRPCRFDAIAVVVTPRGELLRIEHRPGAFDG